jgi:hypothetical protein
LALLDIATNQKRNPKSKDAVALSVKKTQLSKKRVHPTDDNQRKRSKTSESSV